jgi:hypothetical protein
MKATVNTKEMGSSRNIIVQGSVMARSAVSCSPQCPAGTGVLADTQAQLYRMDRTKGGTFYEISACFAMSSILRNVQGLLGSYSNMQDDSCGGKGCFPCGNWFISKDNKCQSCGAGASDRATLNSMGNTFAFATRCVPDICPWPYVVAGQYVMNEIIFVNAQGMSTTTDTPPDYSILPSDICSVQVHLGGTTTTISVIAAILLCIYAASVALAATGQDVSGTRRRKLVIGMLMITVSPAVDFISDLMYIVSTLFYSYVVCIVCCAFYMLPMLFFWRMLAKHGVQFGFYIGKPPAFAVMEKYDSIPKVLLGLTGYIPLYIINLPVLLPLFLVGHVLYCCKVFPISRVSNTWLRLYTRSNRHASSVNIIIPLLQESIFEEMLTESVPQMIIQIVNNTLTATWSPVSYFSTAMSSAMILNGIWRLAYYRIYLKVPINEIPTDLSCEIFTMESVEEGENALIRAATAKVSPENVVGDVASVVRDPCIFLS